MRRRRAHAAAAVIALLALVGGGLSAAQAPAGAGDRAPAREGAARATLPAGFLDTTAIGGISQPVTAAFASDGTAFIGLQTGVIKSFDLDATGQFEAAATSTDFADLSDRVSNYGDRGLTGITVDPQFGTVGHDYVYVNYTYNADPQNPDVFPAWGTPGQAYDNCGPDDADEARIPSSDTDPDQTYRRGCPVMDRVSRLTAFRSALGWEMVPGSEHVLVQDGCAQFSSHSSGDVAFGPDGKLYASAGDGASFRNTDYGQANAHGYPAACPGDPVDEGGSLRAQDQRGTSHGDPLGIDGTIFKLDPATGLTPTQATAGSWLVQMGQRNPWRFTFRHGNQELWSVDVGSSNWEEINRLDDYHQTLANRGWPCYEGTTGQNLVTPQWQPLGLQLCTELYDDQANNPQTVLPPFFSYRTRIGAGPITPGENCPSDHSSAMSGIAFTPVGSGWPAAYQDALFFSDFLRGCIWRFEKDANGQPDPSRVQVFAQAAGAPVDLMTGPGGDLYYVDYGSFTGKSYDAGSGGVHRISWVGATSPATSLTVKSSPRKVRIKVAGTRHRAPYRASFDSGTVVKLLAPRTYAKKGVHYVFAKWRGVKGKHRKKRRLALTIGADPVTLKAVYERVRHRQA